MYNYYVYSSYETDNLFLLAFPLDDISYNNIDLEQPCLICLQDNNVINLCNYSNIIKTCNCQGNFHEECLDTWFSKSSSCPFCRKKVTYLKQEIDFLHYSSFNRLPKFILKMLILISIYNIINIMYIALK